MLYHIISEKHLFVHYKENGKNLIEKLHVWCIYDFICIKTGGNYIWIIWNSHVYKSILYEWSHLTKCILSKQAGGAVRSANRNPLMTSYHCKRENHSNFLACYVYHSFLYCFTFTQNVRKRERKNVVCTIYKLKISATLFYVVWVQWNWESNNNNKGKEPFFKYVCIVRHMKIFVFILLVSKFAEMCIGESFWRVYL